MLAGGTRIATNNLRAVGEVPGNGRLKTPWRSDLCRRDRVLARVSHPQMGRADRSATPPTPVAWDCWTRPARGGDRPKPDFRE